MGKPNILSTFVKTISGGWKVLKDNGLASSVANLVMAGGVATIAWMTDHLPLSVICLLGVLTFAIGSNGYYHFRLARSVRSFDPAKARDLGLELSDFARRASQALVDYDRNHPRAPIAGDGSVNVVGEWEKQRDWEARRAAEFNRYLGEAIAHLAVLKELGMIAPFHTTAGASSRPQGLIAYFAAVGHLLTQGRLSAARGLNDSRDPQEARVSITHIII